MADNLVAVLVAVLLGFLAGIAALLGGMVSGPHREADFDEAPPPRIEPLHPPQGGPAAAQDTLTAVRDKLRVLRNATNERLDDALERVGDALDRTRDALDGVEQGLPRDEAPPGVQPPDGKPGCTTETFRENGTTRTLTRCFQEQRTSNGAGSIIVSSSSVNVTTTSTYDAP